MPDKNGIPTVDEIYDALMPKADDPRIQKKPVKVIKKGDMSPETKALPDEVVKPPKGIGRSENDMGPYRRGLEMLSKEEYEKLMKSLNDVDLSKIVELDDETDLSGEVACAGGACEITLV